MIRSTAREKVSELLILSYPLSKALCYVHHTWSSRFTALFGYDGLSPSLWELKINGRHDCRDDGHLCTLAIDRQGEVTSPG